MNTKKWFSENSQFMNPCIRSLRLKSSNFFFCIYTSSTSDSKFEMTLIRNCSFIFSAMRGFQTNLMLLMMNEDGYLKRR